MNICCVLHASFEKVGVIEDWARRNNHELTFVHSYRAELLPKHTEFEMLILMGGPQSACELEKYDYLLKEVSLVKETIAAHKPVLGICLGAQIIGYALGAKAEKSLHKEVGVYPVRLTKEGLSDPIFKQFGPEFEVMHWHNDMPGLASSAVLLATSKGCQRQAFKYGEQVYGLQFHLELTPKLIADMVEHCPQDLKPDMFVQSKSELLQKDLVDINEKMHKVLDYLATFIPEIA